MLEHNRQMDDRIQEKDIPVEWAQMWPQFHAVSASGGDLTTLFPLYRAAPPDVAPSRWSLSLAKRCFDLLFAAVALLLLWPLLLVTCLLVRCESPGPVIFRQKRVGRHGVLFTVFKFRTMTIAGRKEGPSLTKRGDPRVTRIGRFLRDYKLDELPQLFNVLRGQMSLIGPRPKLAHLEAMPMPFRPGLTGAATLAFRREEEMLQDVSDDDLEVYYCRMIKPLKSKIDWDYMRAATFASDLALIYKTARCCVSTRANSWAVDFSESAKSLAGFGPPSVPGKQVEVKEMVREVDKEGHLWPRV
jgi:lipopolysaccharide/colanic/teichoic acid biosynthesis glycosyltransferase